MCCIEEAHRRRALQRNVVQIVVEGDTHLFALGALVQALQAGAGAVNHQIVVIGEGEDDGVVADAAIVLQHRPVGRPPDRDARHVAGDDVIADGGGVAPAHVNLLEPGHIEEARALPHRVVLVARVGVVAPGRPHAVPVLEVGAERPMVRGQRRFAFTHRELSLTLSFPSVAGRSHRAPPRAYPRDARLATRLRRAARSRRPGRFTARPRLNHTLRQPPAVVPLLSTRRRWPAGTDRSGRPRSAAP